MATEHDTPLELLTEPLSEREWSRFFHVGRRKIAAILERIDNAERVDGRWRIPLSKAPPTYWLARGLLQPREIEPDQFGALWRITSRNRIPKDQ